MKHRAKPRTTQQAIYTFQVESLSHEGRGIAHYGSHPDHPKDKHGKKVFIGSALPGETVKAKITREVKKLEEADFIELLSEPSAIRAEPQCPHYGICGGCNMQHIKKDEQILLKQNVLKSHLEHFAGIQPEKWLEPIRSLREDYRRKARVGVRYIPNKDKLVVGFRERASNLLTNIDRCVVLDKEFGSLTTLKQLFQSLKGKAEIGHVELAMGDAEIALLVRHTDKLCDADVNVLKEFTLHKQWQLYLQPAGAESVHRVDDAQAAMRLHYNLNDFDIKFAFHPLDFTQVNSTINPQMVKMACELLELKGGERVLDLFCGLGNFSLPLARCVGATGEVIAVEGSDEMVHRGAENAKLNGLSNIKFHSQDLTKDFSHHSWANQGFDALLIDPPRSGAEEVMSYVPKFGATKIVYVSCNPATLARDAKLLEQQGYRLKVAGVMDMFTHTGHVESIALFEKKLVLNDE
ncbi:23S rRNA (uracil(1939)-C(5))-methyltransferase RlmD [Acinetobacter faecalis]|uniref:23S rRNA (uracil(1939)-C(5))-methyltransferase RlmD n=1 Tax=Acinetobacter faecalis TaxID=2665161 RepID=UPI002A91D5AE|nr:23S rRNA (uracil(1939)-C(5))-methyltransferase RlmD [Acinetobacter faecalis]MDY6450093.1 23S rRNA (uracil(1939)-C(5))-methyltransferase RlmD [Acinetobacter faecalis]MDY6456414.1 23S rRNA (uracil(1939)-C(5))-methyltransferase RlmD [Acinetobacter faecalis]MDY6468079.1 23S rRNA (uracil(1939)-C(5))-methyltransferase RlmD [Acinetobacter faecalis]